MAAKSSPDLECTNTLKITPYRDLFSFFLMADDQSLNFRAEVSKHGLNFDIKFLLEVQETSQAQTFSFNFHDCFDPKK